MTDEFTKQGLAIDVNARIRSPRVIDVLSRLVESFNGKFRDECLSLEWFRSRAEAKVIIETWRRHYNEVRPHSSLGYLTPKEFVARLPKAASRHATGQDAAVRGPSRPGPLHNPLRKEHMHGARDAISS